MRYRAVNLENFHALLGPLRSLSWTRGPPPVAQAYEISNLAKDFKISIEISRDFQISKEISRFPERFLGFRRDFLISGEISRFPKDFQMSGGIS